MNKNILFLFAITIPLLTMGLGCTSPSTTPSIPDSSLTSPTSPIAIAPTPTTPSSDETTRALVAAKPDATWVLYTNKALGYTINTPTKGSYVPTWEMKYVDQSDLHMIDGCYFHTIPTSKFEKNIYTALAPDGTKFCHTKNEFGDPPSLFVVDDYATVFGNKFIVIEFTKITTDASAFNASEYQNILDGIMGTFNMNAESNSAAESAV